MIAFLNCLIEMWVELKKEGYTFEDHKLIDPNGEVVPPIKKPKYTPYSIKDAK